MISNENKEFLKEMLEPHILNWEEAVKQAQFWTDFKYADSLGWTFKLTEHCGIRMHCANRDSSTGWVADFYNLLVEVMMICGKEQHDHPQIIPLRLLGWKCKVTQWSHLTQAYCYNRDGVIEPLYVNADAAWAALVRSQA